jgi:hypothetical protein
MTWAAAVLSSPAAGGTPTSGSGSCRFPNSAIATAIPTQAQPDSNQIAGGINLAQLPEPN